jgi:hypothetical protein
MTEYRVHYMVWGYPRCGSPSFRNETTDPTKVTCETCKRLMKGEVK